ncbi:MAG: hypothetical protein B7Z80_00960 [Rhodospirillales bacterium 20-64-7]|nr:MAG: hypothetical protein B7Z80_00960 [Rhodospirillales bacterium 20-64-7]
MTSVKRPVQAIDQNGVVVYEFDSIRSARKAGFGSNIAQACKKKLKTSRGYEWRYKPDTLPNEKWVPHPYFPIRCSTLGRIEFSNGRRSFGAENGQGYPTVRVGQKCCYVHRLILEAFDPCGEIIWFYSDANYKPQVDHIDGVRTNNKPENLQWLTTKEHGNKTFSTYHNS